MGTAVPCCRSCCSFWRCFLLTIRSNGVIHQRSPEQPGSSPTAHPFRENGKQQRFPHKGAWGGCHAMPSEPKSSGFPVSPGAVWSLMRYWTGLLDLVWFYHPASPVAGGSLEKWSAESVLCDTPTLVSLFSFPFPISLPLSSFRLFPIPGLPCVISDKKGVAGRSRSPGRRDEAVKPQLSSTSIQLLPWGKSPAHQSAGPSVFFGRRALPSPAQTPYFWCIMKGCCCDVKNAGIHFWSWIQKWPLEERNSIQGQWRSLITQSFCILKFY